MQTLDRVGVSLLTVDLSCEGGQGPLPLPLRRVQGKVSQVYQRRGALASVWGWGACSLLLPCSLEQAEAPVRLDSAPWPPVGGSVPPGYLPLPRSGALTAGNTPRLVVSLELRHTLPEWAGTQAEGSHGRGGRRTPQTRARGPPAHPWVRGHIQREERPSLVLLLARAGPPQFQPSWSSPTAAPTALPPSPLTGPHLPTETTARSRACCPALLGSSGSRLCLSPPNGSTLVMGQPHGGSPGWAPGGLLLCGPAGPTSLEPGRDPCQVCPEAPATLCRQGSCVHHPTALRCWELHSGWENPLCSTPAPSPRVLRGGPLPARAPPRQVL